jgi:hypothetical protein
MALPEDAITLIDRDETAPALNGWGRLGGEIEVAERVDRGREGKWLAQLHQHAVAGAARPLGRFARRRDRPSRNDS